MGVIVDLCDKVLRLYNFCTQDVAAGILYDDRSKDVLPQKAPKTLHAVVSHRNILANMCGICGPFRDKNFTMYDFANAVRSIDKYTCITIYGF